MVFFICNYCGESLKKQVVDKHVWRCKRPINVSCMDCLKDFPENSYNAHTSCISEAEKYSGKDYVPKANANKGAKKQEGWIATLRSIRETKKNLPPGIMAVFEVIQRNDNIAKKKKGFVNFFQNSARHILRKDVEAAWNLIEEEVNRNKQEQQNAANGNDHLKADKSSSTKPNGTEIQNGAATKRKAEEAEKVDKPKKQKKNHPATNGSHVEETKTVLNEEENISNGTQGPDETNNGESNGNQKFRWTEVMRDLLISKNNQMKLTKLKKKVLKKYLQYTGGECDQLQIDGKLDKLFNKKLRKANLFVENDTVRLID